MSWFPDIIGICSMYKNTKSVFMLFKFHYNQASEVQVKESDCIARNAKLKLQGNS